MGIWLHTSEAVTATFATPQEIVINNADDSIAIYGHDGSANRRVKTDSNGELQVDVLTSLGVLSDKSSFTEGTGSFRPIGGVFNNTLNSDPSEDQAAAARITPKRAFHINLRDATGLELGTNDQPLPVAGSAYVNADVFSDTGTGVVIGVGTAVMQNFTIQVYGDAPATGWTVNVEGSLDGVAFSTVLVTHATADGDAALKFTSGKPVLYARCKCTALTLGSATYIVAILLGNG